MASKKRRPSSGRANHRPISHQAGAGPRTGPSGRSPAVRIVAGVVALMMVGSLAFVVVGGGSDQPAAPAPTVPTTTDPCPAADKSDAPRLTFPHRPTWCLANGVEYTAVFDTTEGEVRVSLDRDTTPETVNNFVVLARYGYYDGTLLFRFDPSIDIIQGGAPHTNSWSDPGPGYTIPDEGGEFTRLVGGGLTGPFTYQAGDLVMARSAGPDSSGAQFFFGSGPRVSLLDGQGSYLRFGRADEAGRAVLTGMMDLYEVDETSPYGGGPSREVFLRSVTIEEG